MKKIIIAFFAFSISLFSNVALAAGGGCGAIACDKADYDLSNNASLQNGARLYMNYCAGCHETQYQRYGRVAEDLGISSELMEQNLIFTGAKLGEAMKNAMNEEQAAQWFGTTPPDLTLVARVRGADWIYTYLRSFYKDDSRPFGVNNLVFKDVGMPHVLEALQGVPHKLEAEDGQLSVESDGRGEYSDDEYDAAVLDLVNFLVYSSEPIQLERQRLGYWVIGFLLILLVFTYLLKKEYWRDVH